jgi:hypothetical protein
LQPHLFDQPLILLHVPILVSSYSSIRASLLLHP